MAFSRLIPRAAAGAFVLSIGSASFRAGAAPADDDEDLEVPAAKTSQPAAPTTSAAAPAPSAPAATPSAPAPAPVGPAGPAATPSIPIPPPVSPPASAPAPKAPPADTRVAELERRLAALEEQGAERKAEPKSGPPKTEPAKAEAPVFDPTPFVPVFTPGFAVSGYIQADYHADQTSRDELLSKAPVNQNRFYLRRGRVRFDRTWEYAAATLELDANTVGAPVVGVRRAEASLFYRGSNAVTLPPIAILTAGITDLPFGYEVAESERTAPFVERSLASSALFPTKQDAAVKVSGAASFLRYAVAISNGEPVDARGLPRDPNSAKDVTGRFGAVVTPTPKLELTGGASFATGRGFHAGESASKAVLVWTDNNEDGIRQDGEVLGQPARPAKPSKNFKRWAFGLDLGLRMRTSLGETHLYGELYVGSNYDRGLLVSDPIGTQGIDVRQLGGYAALTQDVTRYGIVGFRVSVYDPNADILEQRADKTLPKLQTIRTLSPMIGLKLPSRARLLFQYDFTQDYIGRTRDGVPADAKNDGWTARLQVDL